MCKDYSFPLQGKRCRIKCCLCLLAGALVLLLLFSACLYGCKVDKAIERQPSDSQRDGSEPSHSLEGEPDKRRSVDAFPDYEIHITAVPESIQGRWYCPSIDRVLEILLKDHQISDFQKTITQVEELPGQTTFTHYDSTVVSIQMSTTGDFLYHRNKKISEDVSHVWPRTLSPFAAEKSGARLFYDANAVSVMPKEAAVELAHSTMKQLGYENMLLLDVTVMPYDKILEKTLEQKRFHEEYKKTHPEYELYDYKLDWKEEDGKYVVTFLVTTPDGVPVYDKCDVYMDRNLIK